MGGAVGREQMLDARAELAVIVKGLRVRGAARACSSRRCGACDPDAACLGRRCVWGGSAGNGGTCPGWWGGAGSQRAATAEEGEEWLAVEVCRCVGRWHGLEEARHGVCLLAWGRSWPRAVRPKQDAPLWATQPRIGQDSDETAVSHPARRRPHVAARRCLPSSRAAAEPRGRARMQAEPCVCAGRGVDAGWRSSCASGKASWRRCADLAP